MTIERHENEREIEAMINNMTLTPTTSLTMTMTLNKGINKRDEDYNNVVDFTEKFDHTEVSKNEKKNRKIKKEKEREVYGDNGCIRCALEGVPLVIIVTSCNEAQAATAE